jgi:hypothetical protein
MRDGEEPICRAASEGGECLLVPGSSRQTSDRSTPHPLGGVPSGRFDHCERAAAGRFDFRPCERGLACHGIRPPAVAWASTTDPREPTSAIDLPEPEVLIARMQAAEERLAAHAAAQRPGLTRADEATGERWEQGQVFAHLAEFPTYWVGQIRAILAARAAGEPSRSRSAG